MATRFPDLIVPAEAGTFEDVEDCFSNGYCHALAVSIWRVAGWEVQGLYVLNWKTGRGEPPDHYVATRPDGHLADVTGIHPPEYFLRGRYHYAGLSEVRFPDDLWEARDMEVAEVVRDLAEEVARRIVNGE